MIYYKEKLFLEALPDYLIRDLLTYNFWNETEKIIIKNMFENRNNKKTIDYMISNGILNYERAQAFEHYKNGLLKLRNFLENTESPIYKTIYKILIKI